MNGKSESGGEAGMIAESGRQGKIAQDRFLTPQPSELFKMQTQLPENARINANHRKNSDFSRG
jgi:hypothetical protein